MDPGPLEGRHLDRSELEWRARYRLRHRARAGSGERSWDECRLTSRCRRTAASVATLPLAAAAERRYRWADKRMPQVVVTPEEVAFLRERIARFEDEAPPQLLWQLPFV